MSRLGIAFGLIGLAILSGCCCVTAMREDGYQKIDGKWSWVNMEMGFAAKVTSISEDEAFQILDNAVYAKDSTSVYLADKVVTGADPATFSLIGNGYSKDASGVFRYTERILESDPETFEVFDKVEEGQPIHLTKDKARVYFDGREIPGADPATFKVLEWYYYADADQVFYFGEPLAGADPKSFQFLDGGYTKDDQLVFWSAKPLENTDAASFESLGDYFARDRDQVYLFKTMVPGADSASFRVLKGPYGRDATTIFCGIQRMEVEHPERFEVVRDESYHPESGWARDGEFYYWGPQRVEGADYASFKPLTSNSAADKNRQFDFPYGDVEWWPYN